jgi:hypothetical protein
MKILVAGDSFSADWSVKYPGKGWPNLLAEKYAVTNVAQAGVSEYKILCQINNIVDMSYYDVVVISHTSPSRVVTRRHPIHSDDLLHANADLSLSDIRYHASTFKQWFNAPLRSAYNFFMHHYDDGFQETVFSLLKNEIHRKIHPVRCIVVNNFINQPDLDNNCFTIDLSGIQLQHSGLLNHLSDRGNQIVFEMLDSKLNEL